MKVTVVEMRATGMKLTGDELRAQPAHEGELFVDGRGAYLCAGPRPREWPEHGRVLPTLYGAKLTNLRGDSFVLVGEYLRDGISVHATSVQAWWCRPVESVSPASALAPCGDAPEESEGR